MKMMRLFAASLVGTLLAVGVFVALASPAQASRGSATATLTISGCTLHDTLTWKGLPAIFQVNWNFYADDKFISPGKEDSSHGPFHSPLDLGSYTKKTSTTSYTFHLTYELLDHSGKIVATATSPTVTGSCVPNS